MFRPEASRSRQALRPFFALRAYEEKPRRLAGPLIQMIRFLLVDVTTLQICSELTSQNVPKGAAPFGTFSAGCASAMLCLRLRPSTLLDGTRQYRRGDVVFAERGVVVGVL